MEFGVPSKAKTPLDYLGERGELVPVQVRLPRELVDGVKARLQKHNMTFTELVRAACQWYLECPDAAIAETKRRTGRSDIERT
jgi:hypothetical protein